MTGQKLYIYMTNPKGLTCKKIGDSEKQNRENGNKLSNNIRKIPRSEGQEYSQ